MTQPLSVAPLDIATSAHLNSQKSSPDAALQAAEGLVDKLAGHAKAVDYDGGFPSDEFGWLAEAGLLAAPLASAYGGAGLNERGNFYTLLQVLKAVGRGSLPVGRVYEGHVNALQLIQTFGTPDQLKRYAADVLKENRVFAVWNAEAADGIRFEPLAGGRYRMNGSKTFTSGGGYVTRPIVPGALPDGGWQMCVVPMEQVETRHDPSWWQPMGMKASASYKIDFNGVELGPEDMLGQPNEYTLQPWFGGGAVRFTAVQLGGAEALLNATVEFLRQAKRLDDPYQKMRISAMAIAVESGNLWLQGAAQNTERHGPIFFDREAGKSAAPEVLTNITGYANMTRSAIERICLDVLETTERAVGARGLLQPQPFERMIRDLRHYLRQPAVDVALANVGQVVLESNHPASSFWSRP